MNISLSICVLTYNRAEILRETLQHLFEVCEDDWEIVVSNNNSDDHTVDVLKAFDGKRRLYRYASTEKTFSAQMNAGRSLRMARGEYCYFFSDDDRLLKDGFENVFQKLKARPDVVAAYAGHRESLWDKSFSRDCFEFDEDMEFDIDNYADLLNKQVIALPIAKTSACMNNYIINEGTNYPFRQQLFSYLSQGKVIYVRDSIYNHIQTKVRMENDILTSGYTEGVRACLEAGIGIAFTSPEGFAKSLTENILFIQHNVFKSVIFAGRYLCGDDAIVRRVFYGGTKSETIAEYRKYHRANLIAEHLSCIAQNRSDLKYFIIEDGHAASQVKTSLEARSDTLPVKICMKGAAINHPYASDEFVVLQSTADLVERERKLGAKATHQDSLEALLKSHE